MTMTKRVRRSTRTTSPTLIARMERLFRQDKLPAEDRGPRVVAQEAERTRTVGAVVAADAADRVAAAGDKPVQTNRKHM